MVPPTAEGPSQSEAAKKPVMFKDECTVFLSNLALNVRCGASGSILKPKCHFMSKSLNFCIC